MKLEIKNADTCYVCGAREIATNYSLHVWNIRYNCGCEIFGAVGNNTDVTIITMCPYSSKIKS
jgi:hypothetical protein